ncbi:MAG: MarR family transcriptional regulator [Hirschia sp.]|nr:MarR family transcriptional regulator [Hirschia sp.]MBF19130.1 MarR family transcriptional regulator [Hirschia sp.]|tara:strand:+ start:653 stop:1144 length:492 start_codon:yes stop_codon:yes gene_type:complete
MPSGFGTAGAADARLYLRESELDQGARLLRAAWRNLRARAAEAAGDIDLTESELDILIELINLDNADVTTLRTQMNMPKQSMTRHLQSLEDKALLVRKRCVRDGRRRLLALTAEGARIATRAAEGWRDAMSSAYMAAGPEDVASTRRLLAMLANAHDAGDKGG